MAADSKLNLKCAFIYTREAHASDKWPMKWAVEWPEPRSLEERLGRAQQCDKDLGWSNHMEVYVDGMSDGFCDSFKAWPAGCYVLGPGAKLLFAAAPKGDQIFFNMSELSTFLKQLHPSEWGV